jgi:hypothetical protein
MLDSVRYAIIVFCRWNLIVIDDVLVILT